MSINVYIALSLWLPISIWCVSTLGSVRGCAAAIVGGFLFLPPVSLPLIDGAPPLDRDGVVALSALLALLIASPASLVRYRFHPLDLLPLIGAFIWSATNLLNGIGAAQAMLDFWWYVMFAGIPYYIGRTVLQGSAGLRSLAVAIVGGTIIAIPLIVYEARFSPILNYQIYGFTTGNAMERFRMDGWRPRLFQPAGLGLAVWLAASAVIAWSLYFGATGVRILRLKSSHAAWACLIAGLLSRGAGAISLMVMGLLTLLLVQKAQVRKLVLAVPLICCIYLGTALVESSVPVRPTLLSASTAIFGEDRGASLETRFRNEEILVQRAMQKPLWGWGGWGDYRVAYDLAYDAGFGTILTDGFWVIVLGKRGLLGLAATWGWFLIPGVLAILQALRIGMARSGFIVVLGISMFGWIYALDLLFNAFPSIVQALVAGALASFVHAASRVPKGGARPKPRTAIRGTRPKSGSSGPVAMPAGAVAD